MAHSESDLLRLLHSTEHSFVERKSIGDSRDWVKTVVAFANTLSIGQEGVLFIGATDAGEIESGASNLDKLQKTLSEKMQNAFPPVWCTTQTVRENDRECLVVVVPGSPSRPHFAGPPYLRDGSQSIVASTSQYELMLATRIAKSYELQKWEGKLITLRILSRQNGMAYVISQNVEEARLVRTNQFYLTVFYRNRNHSYPLGRLEISYDDVADRLEVQVEGLPAQN